MLRLDVLSTASINDDAGNALTASFTTGQTFTIRVLQVSTFTPTNTGFVADFSQAPNPSASTSTSNVPNVATTCADWRAKARVPCAASRWRIHWRGGGDGSLIATGLIELRGDCVFKRRFADRCSLVQPVGSH
jgi:hypothetical protein